MPNYERLAMAEPYSVVSKPTLTQPGELIREVPKLFGKPCLGSADIDPSDYYLTRSFINKCRNKLKGIFTPLVVRACFDGVEFECQRENICIVGELADCLFGLVIDKDTHMIVEGWVLEVNQVQASMSNQWSEETVNRMKSVVKDYTGTEWNSQRDPRVGNSSVWMDDSKYGY